ncbi:acetyl-CoA C-acetyltransferase [Subtercola boreus]|uniref:Probable acetyl-CoA acetyltransferase n=1 Tax=Subtercola boreus TaxID=120213 RepID=A0A3E0WAK6_9MICO|nr:acetyl-CoA C-acetyltransferase [Subtercola boreus]RFA19130.1 acetyl-CoA acetyltransferase [Subtercola boreus]RFA19249.1 acetyl-CoA acetyltransferase [Subtercola boreus]RFA25729.1 acetyl-CoA acetyltransferase [Subtercola boreus]
MQNSPTRGTDAVIVAGARTPFGRLLGQLASLSAVQLGAAAIRGALDRAGVDAADVDVVIMGQVLQAGQGQNPARQSALSAGIGWNVPAVTLNKVCLSGLEAIIDAARLIQTGEASVVVAGGQESMTNAPHVLPTGRTGQKFGNVTLIDTAAFDGLTDAYDGESMGLSTEKGNGRLTIERPEQDAVALQSHLRAAAAQASGVFDDEIVPVEVPSRRGAPTVLSVDEGVRGESTLESLSALRPAFSPEGTITAGNSSPLSDGAAAVVVTSRAYAEAHGLTWLAVVGAAGQVAGPDNSLQSQPSRAIAAALARSARLAAERGGQGSATPDAAPSATEVTDLDFIEINEAFAAVSVQSMRDLGIDDTTVNLHGGAIALGHPIGASGARIALHAALELSRRGTGHAAVAMCGGGGQGDALLLSL